MEEKIYLVNESLNEFARRGRPPKIRPPVIDDDPEMKDTWYNADDEFDSEPTGPTAADIENVEIADEVGDLQAQKILRKRLEAEISSSPEFSRISIKFKTPSGLSAGIPMAKLSGDAFLIKTPNGMKKVRLSDMIAESEEPTKYVSESLKDYE